MTIWDGLATPENNAITMRLAHKGDHATWSWIRQSDRKVGIAIEIVGDYFSPAQKNSRYTSKSVERLIMRMGELGAAEVLC